MADFSGFINLNKPQNWSSHDCVARVRRLLNMKKVGHGGTLDPLATGVLPVAVGRATRLIQYLPARKAYCATVRFGVTTTTDDLEGTVIHQQSAAHLQVSDVEALLPKFTGVVSQTPPMFSAIQVEGKRLYDLARKGRHVDVPVREVTIHQLSILDWQNQGETCELMLAVDCGPGTYIRSLARDMGAAVGTGATLAGLVRTHSNGFELGESMTLADLEEAIAQDTFSPFPGGEAIQHLPSLRLTLPLAKRWCMGQKLALSEPALSDELSLRGLSPSDIEQALIEQAPWVRSLRILCERTFLGIGEIKRSDYSPSDHSNAGHVAHPILIPKMVFTPAQHF
ncbi:MAG: tRNA pseudouridine(55) synthase TruB [Cyanobacteria bacterium P01_D01_bin.105]